MVDSTPAHLLAWKRALRQYGIFKSEQEILAQFGKTNLDISNALIPLIDPHTRSELADLKSKYFLHEMKHVEIYPGAEEILHNLYTAEYEICIVSNSYRESIQKIIHYHNWDQYLSFIVGHDDVTHPKPHPDMIELALEQMKKDAHQSVVIGDSIYDVQAGNAAGTYVIAVCTSHSADYFKPDSVQFIIPNIGDLKKYLPLKFN